MAQFPRRLHSVAQSAGVPLCKSEPTERVKYIHILPGRTSDAVARNGLARLRRAGPFLSTFGERRVVERRPLNSKRVVQREEQCLSSLSAISSCLAASSFREEQAVEFALLEV
jgi:hypothetical protein